MPPVLRSLSVVLLSFTGTACFNYRPVDMATLTPGATVRARLTPAQVTELDGVVTVQGRQLTGTLVEGSGERVLLDVPVAAPAGVPGPPLRQRVALPAAGIVEVEERVLSTWKTAALVGGIAAAVGGVVAWQIHEGKNTPVRDPKDPPDAARLPGVRISIPLP